MIHPAFVIGGIIAFVVAVVAIAHIADRKRPGDKICPFMSSRCVKDNCEMWHNNQCKNRNAVVFNATITDSWMRGGQAPLIHIEGEGSCSKECPNEQ